MHAPPPPPPKINFLLFNGNIYFRLGNFVIPSICFEIATSLKLLAMTHQNKCEGISTL